MQRYVHDMLTVTEEEIRRLFAVYLELLKIIVEPSSAVALAPLLCGKICGWNMRVGVILSGGNVSLPVDELFDNTEAWSPEESQRS